MSIFINETFRLQHADYFTCRVNYKVSNEKGVNDTLRVMEGNGLGEFQGSFI